MELLQDYAGFLLQTITLLIAFAIVLRLIRSGNEGAGPSGALDIQRLDKHFEALSHAINDASMGRKERRKAQKSRKRDNKKGDASKADENRTRIFVLDFKGDIRASAVRSLREEVSAIVSSARPDDEVLLRLESPGGSVTGYGLAASQLTRLKAAGIKLTVAVDQVAASGGYMMACVADHVLGAPFAVFGSIGVVTTIPNVNRLLKRNHVDVEMLTAGDFKRTLTMIGENTEAGRAKMQEQLEDIHDLFKNFVGEHRPHLDLDAVATGDFWQGKRAKELALIDEIGASDDWLLSRSQKSDLVRLSWVRPTTMGGKLKRLIHAALGGTADATRQAELDSRYF